MSAAGLSAASSMIVVAFAGPDPAALWDRYQLAQSAADKLLLSWNETAIAGGTGGETGMAYTGAYQGQLAASQAYADWLAAFNLWRQA